MGTMASDVLGSSGEFQVILNPGAAADVDFRITYPGWTGSRPRRLTREILFVGGALEVEMENGTNVILPATMAGIPLRLACARLIVAGTACTSVLICW